MRKDKLLTPLDLPRFSVLLGAHLSISGGLYKAIEAAKEIKATALQIFTKNQRQWRVSELKREDIEKFKGYWEEWGDYPIFSHVSYLLNLASPKKDIQQKSIEGFVVELLRAESLGIEYIVTHLGSHMGDDEKKALKRFTENMDRAIQDSHTSKVKVLLETTAGQGTNLGYKFSHLRFVMDNSNFPERLGICFDTCHVFAAGYELRDKKGYESTFKELDEQVGLDKLYLIHLNDSKHGLGSKKDRHEHIGKGEIGLEGFRILMNDKIIFNVPKVLETPKGKDLLEDRQNMDTLLSLIK